MEKTRVANDPQERQKLMQAHMDVMQKSMKTMRAMGSPMKLGSARSDGMAVSGKKDTAGGDMMMRNDMMESRMDMMLPMMQQMMQHDALQESARSRYPAPVHQRERGASRAIARSPRRTVCV